jgi:acyl carrier protein
MQNTNPERIEIMQHLEDIKNILADVLSLGDRKKSLTENSPLLGAVSELDSMAVINVITALEDHFGIAVNDDEISAATFDTVGSLAHFVEQKLAG